MNEQHINFYYFLFNRIRPVVFLFSRRRNIDIIDILNAGLPKVSFSSSFYSRYYHYPLLIVFCSLWRISADEISTFWNGTFGDVQWIIPFVSPLPRRLPRVSVRLQVVQSSVHLFPFSCWETSMFRCANSSTKVGRIPFQITACSFSDWEKLCVLCEKYFILWAKALRSKYLALLV